MGFKSGIVLGIFVTFVFGVVMVFSGFIGNRFFKSQRITPMNPEQPAWLG